MSTKARLRQFVFDNCFPLGGSPDPNDAILLESSFAEVTKRGQGKQQLRLGLGLSTLVIAKEILKPVKHSNWKYDAGANPVTEPLARVRFLPLTLVFLSLYEKRPFTVKIKFIQGPVVLLELADRERENMWRCWKEKITFLNDRDIYATTSLSTCSSTFVCPTCPRTQTAPTDDGPPSSTSKGEQLSKNTDCSECNSSEDLPTGWPCARTALSEDFKFKDIFRNRQLRRQQSV